MKALKPALLKICLDKITITVYLDDCLNVDKRKGKCWENTKTIIVNTPQDLGLTVHPFTVLPFTQLKNEFCFHENNSDQC